MVNRCWLDVACPYCGPVSCDEGNCSTHFFYYLGPEEVTKARIQCPVCALVWTVPTGFGVGAAQSA